MLARPLVALLSLLLLPLLVQAQFGGNFFQQMFGGDDDDDDDGGAEDIFEKVKQQQQQQRGGGGQNFGSDSVWYRAQNDRITCDNYLCPDTLACVHFPHHCPCAFPANEAKIELRDGSRICPSHGGFSAGEAARKVELARKGLL